LEEESLKYLDWNIRASEELHEALNEIDRRAVKPRNGKREAEIVRLRDQTGLIPRKRICGHILRRRTKKNLHGYS
jgi:hypothetical protein